MKEIDYIEQFEQRANKSRVFAHWAENGNYWIMARESLRSEYVMNCLDGDRDKADELICESQGFENFTQARKHILKALSWWKTEIQMSVNEIRRMKKGDME